MPFAVGSKRPDDYAQTYLASELKAIGQDFLRVVGADRSAAQPVGFSPLRERLSGETECMHCREVQSGFFGVTR